MIDVDFPASGNCPDCGGFIFRPGPRGGAGQNIECVGCSSRFNVVRYYPRLDPAQIARHGWPALSDLTESRIVWAQRIDNNGEWREDMFPKILE